MPLRLCAQIFLFFALPLLAISFQPYVNDSKCASFVATFYLSSRSDFQTPNWASPRYPKGPGCANIITCNSLPTPTLKLSFYFMSVNGTTIFSDPTLKLSTSSISTFPISLLSTGFIFQHLVLQWRWSLSSKLIVWVLSYPEYMICFFTSRLLGNTILKFTWWTQI